ncbi:hypothetical protein L7F22_002194 [Adiantum nelumboides]|nr:hypothetical protein [Adiantum nelumboides]
MQSEYDALIENDTWTLCDLPPGKKAIGTKWVYKLKHKPDGEIDCYKARLVANGYAHQKGASEETPMLVNYLITRLQQAMANPALQDEVQ